LQKAGGEMKTESDGIHPMTPEEILARVHELKPQFLEGLAPEEVGDVVNAATLRRIHSRTVITREGHDAEKLYLFIEGRGRTFATTPGGEEVILLGIFPGEVAGGRTALREPQKYLVSTETMVDSSTLVWGRTVFLPFLAKYPRVVENGLMTASDYLESYQDLLIAASHDTAGKRVARALDGWAKSIGKRVDDGLGLHINNEELANQANVTIFTVSRLLSEWQRKGLLVKSRGKVVIRTPVELVDSVE
jgi:CRP/FNR family transcriptional regulator, nitrogen oxide reductase regulator